MVYTRESTAERADQRGHGNDEDLQWSTVDIRLVGSHPLWAHHLWNASRAFASYLDENPQMCVGRAVLELGAGGGLPGIVAAKNGARRVVLTDYPDAPLLDNLRYNVNQNIPAHLQFKVHVEGYIWGQPTGPLLDISSTGSDPRGYDLIIMSDLIFNHSQHDALLQTCEQIVSQYSSTISLPQIIPIPEKPTDTPCVLVFFTHHRPHLAHRDMEFFEKARKRGWHCEEVLRRKFPPMFPDDPGEMEIRATVHGWRLTRC